MFLTQKISNKIDQLFEEGKYFRSGFIGGFTDTALIMGLGLVAYGYFVGAVDVYTSLKQSEEKIA